MWFLTSPFLVARLCLVRRVLRFLPVSPMWPGSCSIWSCILLPDCPPVSLSLTFVSSSCKVDMELQLPHELFWIHFFKTFNMSNWYWKTFFTEFWFAGIGCLLNFILTNKIWCSISIICSTVRFDLSDYKQLQMTVLVRIRQAINRGCWEPVRCENFVETIIIVKITDKKRRFDRSSVIVK